MLAQQDRGHTDLNAIEAASLRGFHLPQALQDMQVVFAGMEFPDHFSQSIFLVGPTPRKPDVMSWRPVALELLHRAGYRGAVFVPESPGTVRPSYDDQVAWETDGLKRSDIVLAWAETKKEDMPALCTRTEFGEHLASGRMVFGRPEGAWKTTYLSKKAAEYQILSHSSLEAAVLEAVTRLKPGAFRKGAETLVPLELWRKLMFQEWYEKFKAQGNELISVLQVHQNRYSVPFAVLEIKSRRTGEEKVSDDLVILR